VSLWNESCGAGHVISHVNWKSSNKRPSKCFIITNFAHGLHIFFQMIILKDVFKFSNGNDIGTLQVISFYVIFCGQMKRVLPVRVSSISTSHFGEWDNPCAIREHGIRFTSVSAMALELSETLLWPSICYLSG
jgi:hypothetical protein